MSKAMTRAVSFIGGQTALAQAIGVAPQEVWNWCNGRQVPTRRCPAIERATGVACEELRPDVAWVRMAGPHWPWHSSGRPLLDVAATGLPAAGPADEPAAPAPAATPAPGTAPRVQLDLVRLEFSQEADDWDPHTGQSDQLLTLQAIDGGAGPYLVIETQRWSLDPAQLDVFVHQLRTVLALAKRGYPLAISA